MRKIFLTLSLITLFFSANWACADQNFVNRPDVQAFINMMVKKYDFKKSDVTAVMNSVKIRPQVMIHFNKPLEIEPWRTYQMLFVNEWRIQHGVKFWKAHEEALKRAEATYGVPASIIVATIGIETKYGQSMGEYRVVDSLSSLGFSNSPRAAYFQSELAQLLLLAREQHVDPLKFEGSYAGAIGQPQFMPSSYRYYAVNFSNSGTIDLSNDITDVIGSIANYYHKHGWKKDQPVAQPALTIGNRYNYLVAKHKLKKSFTVAELAKYGVIPKTKIKHTDLSVKVIELPSRFSKEYWLGYHNFYVIKRYNSSDLYAMAVFQLSQTMASVQERLNDGPHH
ncbi:MAG TPA: lytic murein transglycosylase B [Gammaproteobacteria bacterium]|jgi:membrane-bound lytic murein transglycosylase B|nr:lytic murein transglycosylase B [Gammaproteobacteria bacterium]